MIVAISIIASSDSHEFTDAFIYMRFVMIPVGNKIGTLTQGATLMCPKTELQAYIWAYQLV